MKIIRRATTVIVIAGKDKGAAGQGHAAHPDGDRVLVEGVNLIKKHTKVDTRAAGAKEGGIVQHGGADPREQRAAGRPEDEEADPGRLPLNDDGKKVRVCRGVTR